MREYFISTCYNLEKNLLTYLTSIHHVTDWRPSVNHNYVSRSYQFSSYLSGHITCTQTIATDITRSMVCVCLCVGHLVSCAKMAELIGLIFGD